MNGEFLKRFWAKVDKPTTCWEWRGGKNRSGYGQINTGRTKNRLEQAHRVAWELVNGPIPDGMLVLHYCDNPSCVNPDHLHLGTHQENVHEARVRGRLGRIIGDKHHASKVSEEQVDDIVARRHNGESCASIAKRYGLHEATISRLSRGIGRKGQLK